MSRHHTFPRCTREAPYMGRYRPTHALIATTDRILTVFSWQTGCVPVHGRGRRGGMEFETTNSLFLCKYLSFHFQRHPDKHQLLDLNLKHLKVLGYLRYFLWMYSLKPMVF